MRRLILPFLLMAALMLAGCGFTSEGTMVRDAVASKGAQAYDQGLENAEWFICSAASVGSVQRKYGRDQKSADAYNALCSPGRAEIIKPPQ